MTQIPRKLSLGNLALIEWIAENPAKRFLVQNRYDFRLCEIKPEGGLRTVRPSQGGEILAKFGGRARIDTTPLYRGGFISHFDPVGNAGAVAKLRLRIGGDATRDPFHFQDQIYTPKQAMLDFWERDGKRQIAAIRAERAEALAKVERMVILGAVRTIEPKVPEDLRNLLPQDLRLPLPSRRVLQPYATARVVKVSETRVYVADVVRAFDTDYRADPVTGSAAGAYVEPASILMDPATPEAMEELVGIYKERVAEIESKYADTLREIAPALALLSNKLRQGDGMYEDLMREAIARHAEGGPKPR